MGIKTNEGTENFDRISVSARALTLERRSSVGLMGDLRKGEEGIK